MNPKAVALVRALALLAAAGLLFFLFPALFRFAEGAATSAFRLWWLILLIMLGVWLIWGLGRKPR